MTKAEIIEKAKAVLSEEFEVAQEKMAHEASLREVLDLDSLDIVDLVVLVERDFGLKMTKEELMEIRTFSDLYGFLEKKGA